MIETKGLAAGIEAADAAVKSANVRLIGYELTKGGGMVTIKVEGDVGAVKASIEAAAAAASRIGKVISKHIIPRPASGLDKIIYSNETVGYGNPNSEEKQPPSEKPKPVQDTDEEPVEAEQEKEEQTKPETSEKTKEETEQGKTKTRPEGSLDEPGLNDTVKVQENAHQSDSIGEETSKEELAEEYTHGGVHLEYIESPQDEVLFTDCVEDPEEESEGEPAPVVETESEEAVSDIQENEITEKVDDGEVCNLCRDPECPRRKGEKHTLCIHYKD